MKFSKLIKKIDIEHVHKLTRYIIMLISYGTSIVCYHCYNPGWRGNSHIYIISYFIYFLKPPQVDKMYRNTILKHG